MWPVKPGQVKPTVSVLYTKHKFCLFAGSQPGVSGGES